MFKTLLEKVVGSRNERVIKKLWPTVDEINEIYKGYKGLKDEDLLKKTEDFEQRLREGEDPDEILPEAFALVKEACRRLVGKRWEVTGEVIEWNMIPFDVQLIGAIVLHQGKIAEMATGEGKTLVATMPLYLNALIGRTKEKPVGVHLVTVNDYLARRDREWMGPVYESLGLSVGVIQAGMTPEQRKPEYEKDITYGTNNEFGFDYLRDNMVYQPEHRVQRGHFYAIIDEVDSILIDEARTPLIISGPVEHSSVDQYKDVKPIVADIVRKQTLIVTRFLSEAEKLLREGKEKEAALKILIAKRGAPKSKKLFKLLQEPGLMKLVDKTELELMKDKKIKEYEEELYYVVDEKSNSVDITEKGRNEIQKKRKDLFTLPDLSTEIAEIDKRTDLNAREKFYEKERIYREYAQKTDQIHAINQLLKAYTLFEKDVDYVVMDGKVIIVDEFTGRLMHGRRWSDGLHEAVEAKEGVKIQAETQTLATITIQNYFRMYEKLAGMTGTAATEAAEFWEIYKLDVVSIPTNKPVRRVDFPDIIFKTKKEKYEAVINEIVKWHEKGRPILVGTTSVEVSELLSRLLQRRKIPHQVLNAKHHEKEAHIVARAGQKGAVTIATNMAGRGTDIKLGPGVVKAYDLVHEERIKKIKEYVSQGKSVLVIPETDGDIPNLQYLFDKNDIKYTYISMRPDENNTVDMIIEKILNSLKRPGAVVLISGLHKYDERLKQGDHVVMDFPQPECAINTKNPRPGVTCPMDPKKCIEEGVPCGLYVIGTERHESRRIDNQLRGRSGRQGDPGASRFFLSLEDDLLRLFGSDKVMDLMERWGKSDEGPIESKLVTKALESAQKRVEMQNFEIRKRLLEFDDVMNQQREVVYGLRNRILDGENIKSKILDEFVVDIIEEKIEQYLSGDSPDEWDLEGFKEELRFLFLFDFSEIEKFGSKDEIRDFILEQVRKLYEEREEAFGDERMREIERIILLTTLDTAWREHLYSLDMLKEGIFLRAYGQKDPVVEYKQESFRMFEDMLLRIRNETVMKIFRIEVPKMPKRFRERNVTITRPVVHTAATVTPVQKNEKQETQKKSRRRSRGRRRKSKH